MVEKILFAALILLPGSISAAGSPPGEVPTKQGGETAAPAAARTGKSAVRLDEVRITGTPEHPGVLFFLPRARFHLLPLRTEGNGTGPLPPNGPVKGAPGR